MVGRGVAPEGVEVGPVDFLLPYVAERRARPEVAAVRALLETFVPGGPDAGEAYRPLWRRAVAELDAVLDCGPERAEYLGCGSTSPGSPSGTDRARRRWRSCYGTWGSASRWTARSG